MNNDPIPTKAASIDNAMYLQPHWLYCQAKQAYLQSQWPYSKQSHLHCKLNGSSMVNAMDPNLIDASPNPSKFIHYNLNDPIPSKATCFVNAMDSQIQWLKMINICYQVCVEPIFLRYQNKKLFCTFCTKVLYGVDLGVANKLSFVREICGYKSPEQGLNLSES